MTGTRPSPPPQLPSAASTVETLTDVHAVPGNYCLYDDAGVRIDRSLTWTSSRRLGPAPARIELPPDAVTIERPVVFGGLLPKPHFGHVLLEMFSRLWAHDAGHVGRDVPIVHFTHYQRDLEAFERRLLSGAFGGAHPPLIHVDRPLLLKEVVVPSQAVILGQTMQPTVLPLYDRIREHVGGDAVPDSTPVYLSRSRLHGDYRLTLGEAALEERLRRRGVRIIHPQELSLEEQVRSVANAATVIGLAGSALHLTVLRNMRGARTISLDPTTPFAAQREVERLRVARFEHVHAQLPLHPRLPGGRALSVGRYRNLLIPRIVERQVAGRL